MGQSYFERAMNEPVPTANSTDVRRIWSFLALERARDALGQAGVSYSVQVLAEHCEASVNVLAVFLRATLVDALLQQGLLDGWREGNAPSDSVFEVAATFTLPRGLTEVDFQAFITALPKTAH
jgi:hypothetical protein